MAYDGTGYAGWQCQADQPTVQGTLERAIHAVTGERARTLASGRTDAGVHARMQVVGFRTESKLPCDVLERAIGANLPGDIAVLAVEEVPLDFHPIANVVRKRYRYVIHDGPVRDVFRRAYAWKVHQRLDAPAMQRSARALAGTHDFASFQTSGAERATTVRTIYDLSVRRGDSDESDLVFLEVEADGFLYNMVRTIVGTLVEVGRGAEKETWPGEVLAACDRRAAGATAPPCGLFLLRVEYPQG